MSHEIMDNDSMLLVKKPAWHKLGTVVEQIPTVEEAIKLSGLDWQVFKGDLFDKFGNLHQMNYTYRMIDDREYKLGYVTDSYQILQNIEAFTWFNPFIESGQVTLETAGSLLNGEKIFITAKIAGDSLEVDKDDFVEKFILLSNSHNGKTAVRVGFTPIRVVCNNTLKMAHSNKASQLIRIKHTMQLHNNLNLVRDTIDMVNQQFITTVEQYRLLASRDINSIDLKKYIKTVFSKENLELQFVEFNTKQDARQRLEIQINQLFEQEDKHNLWTAYNAVQGYLQHERGTKNTTLESRYNSLWFGDSDRLNQKALNVALTMV